MVPEVGRESIPKVQLSIDGMAEMTRRVIESGATSVILISPHAPLEQLAFVAYPGPMLAGDFSDFSAPAARIKAPVDQDLLDAIRENAETDDYEVLMLRHSRLDHGTAVPLYFLQRNGWNGSVVALGYSYLTNEHHVRFGTCIRKAVDQVGRRVAFVASGDLSHRLLPEAPAGYNPVAHLFDEEIIEALRDNRPEQIAHIDPELRKLAGECGYRSMLVALGVTKDLPLNCDVLSYEAPFGVGYIVAQMTKLQESDQQSLPVQYANNETHINNGDDLPALARRAVESFVRTGAKIESPLHPSGLLAARAACFVSLKTKDGELRGCIGTIEPVEDTLSEELITNALNACTRDPRFPPVEPGELSDLVYSVDVLSTPQPATFEDLDPSIYGVIVEDQTGARRGLLLPDIEGVDTATKQVEIATRKAGIPPGSPITLFRFSVQRFREARQAE